MAPHPTLHADFERLIGTAAVDHSFGAALLGNPHATALEFGLSQQDAALVAGIQARGPSPQHAPNAAVLPIPRIIGCPRLRSSRWMLGS